MGPVDFIRQQKDRVRARQEAEGGTWEQARKKGYSDRAMANRFIDAQNRLGEIGPEREDAGYEGLRDFDPSAAFEQYTRGATDSAHSFLGEELEKLAGTAAGQGRLNTGFYDKDQGDVVRNVMGDLNNTIAGAALQTTGMDLSRRGKLLDYGTDTSNRYLDLLTGNNDRITARENARKQSKGGGVLDFAAKALPVVASFL